MDQKISFVVDGRPATVSADPAMPLLYALHSELGLNNPKFGCGKAQCGACTVHVDGAPVRSCAMPVSAAAGKRVTTLAGLGTPEKPHPLGDLPHPRAGRRAGVDRYRADQSARDAPAGRRRAVHAHDSRRDRQRYFRRDRGAYPARTDHA